MAAGLAVQLLYAGQRHRANQPGRQRAAHPGVVSQRPGAVGHDQLLVGLMVEQGGRDGVVAGVVEDGIDRRGQHLDHGHAVGDAGRDGLRHGQPARALRRLPGNAQHRLGERGEMDEQLALGVAERGCVVASLRHQHARPSVGKRHRRAQQTGIVPGAERCVVRLQRHPLGPEAAPQPLEQLLHLGDRSRWLRWVHRDGFCQSGADIWPRLPQPTRISGIGAPSWRSSAVVSHTCQRSASRSPL